MSNMTTIDLSDRYEALFDNLSFASSSVNTSLESNIALIGVARLGSLMSTDEGKAQGDKAAADINGVLGRINDELTKQVDDVGMPSEITPLANLAAYELVALNDHKPLGHSNETNTKVKVLLGKVEESVSTIGRLSLSRPQELFDKRSTEKMPTLISFIKGEGVDISDSQLAEIALIANQTLDASKRKQDTGLIQGSFLNLVNHKVFEEVQHRVEDNPALSSLMFTQFGDSFAAGLYNHAIQGNDDYAMNLLSNSNYGLLKDSKTNVVNNPQVKSLMQLVVKSGGSEANIDRLISMANTSDSLDVMLEGLVEAHNNHYNSQNLSNALDKIGASMSLEQLKRFGEVLVKNHQDQPVLPALQKILDISNERGQELGHLERASSQIRQELNAAYGGLTAPMSAYSTVTIDFPSANTSLAIRDSKSVPHLRLMIENSVGAAAGTLDFEINHSNSLLDTTIESALTDYITNNDATKLNDLMALPIRGGEKDTKKRAQLLFEANKQNKSLPPLALDHINMLSDVVDKKVAVHASDSHVISLSDFHSTNDIVNKLAQINPKSLSIDETGLGGDYDKKLLAAIKDFAEQPDNKQKQSDLNDLVGLPVTELSSKIENQQQNSQSDGNFIKKVTDSLLITARAPK